MIDTTTTRRAALGALIAAPLAIGASAAAQPPASAAAFEEALAAFKRADALHDAALAVHSTVEEAFYAAVLPRRPMAEMGIVLFADGRPTNIEEATAAFEAETAARKRADAHIRQRLGLDEAEERADLAGDVAHDALHAVIACPAPDLAAVAAKIELADARGLDIADLAPVLADLQRLGGKGAA